MSEINIKNMHVAHKKLTRYPTIEIEGDMYGKILNWFANNNLSVLVPPVFPEFVIRYDAGGRLYVPVSMIPQMLALGMTVCDSKPTKIGDLRYYIPPRLEPHKWMRLDVTAELLVRYTEERTAFVASLYEDGQVTYEFLFDYNDINPETGNMIIRTNNDSSASLHIQEIAMFIAAVQSYVLYHKPKEIPAPDSMPNDAPDNTSPKPRKKPNEAAPRKPAQNRPVHINSHVRKRTITIRENDEMPTRKYNYVTMIWQTRGHYQRYGKEKKLKYVAPHLNRRRTETIDPEAELTNPKTYVIRQTYEPDEETETKETPNNG